MNSFTYHTNDHLPKLAWCMVMGSGNVTEVFHGAQVETRDAWFAEGAWDSPFEEGKFQSSELFMGSGARLADEGVLIAAPCHTLEKVYSLRKGSELYFSNSLAFLLTRSGSRLDINHIHYHTDLASILLGLRECVKSIPTSTGEMIGLHYYCNIHIDRNLKVVELDKPKPQPFGNYGAYKSYCLNGLKRIFENAHSPLRKVSYSPLVTMSSGYDSSCCAALAKDAGCEQVVTISQLNPKAPNDSGTRIATCLGYRQIKEIGYEAYRAIQAFSEVESLATGDLSLIRFNIFERECENSVLITGINGDVVWDKNNGNAEHLRRKELNLGGLSSGIAEFRLRVGFIHVPLCFFGAIEHGSLYRISNSDEMLPWTIGGSYDRPIPRRILEEKGVDRDSFGKAKQGIGIGVSYFTRNLSPESYKSLSLYIKSQKSKRSAVKETCFWIPYLVCIGIKGFNSFCKRKGLSFMRIPNIVPFKFVRSPGMPSYMICWAIDQISERYKI